MPAPTRTGALVVSLDFELGWGVWDTLGTTGAYRGHLLGAREAVPRMLDLFAKHGVAVTWATVGFLFAASREEVLEHAPSPHPRFDDPGQDPYRVLVGPDVGEDERRDPIHYAASLVRLIASAPRQELGSHTFAHLAPGEPGLTSDDILGDLKAARAIGAAHGHDLRSLVTPRHQVRPQDLPLVAAAGFHTFRSPEPNLLGRPSVAWKGPLAVRAVRLADTYVSLTGPNRIPWPKVGAHGLVDVAESRFLRPASRRLAALEPLRVARVARAMESAARRGTICHVWWHPHNFGADLEANLANLAAVLRVFERLRGEAGFESLSMGEVSDRVRRGSDQSR